MLWSWDIGDDVQKLERAKKVKIDVIDRKNNRGKFIGSSGEIYRTNLLECTCVDFSIKKTFCKHMLRLAIELGVVNRYGRTPEQQQTVDLTNEKNTLALSYGYFYLFGTELLSDEEYDSLKTKLSQEIIVRNNQPKNAQDDHFHSFSCLQDFIKALDEKQIPYLDKRSVGGSLWIKMGVADNFVSKVKIAGKKMLVANSPRTFNGEPGWYYRE
ncbi:MAG: SWIM zinc finger family protein [Clostridia bacterium]|nr:SWIM zinc finger family protein [Clostridia bacterium]